GLADRAEQAAGHVEAGITFKVHALDRVAVPLDFAVDHRVRRSAIRHRPESSGDQDLAANLFGPLFPRVGIRARHERKIAVKIFEVAQSAVSRKFSLGKRSRSSSLRE